MPDAGRRRALGQHFLRDAGVARAIADLLAPTPADLVLEIGPGGAPGGVGRGARGEAGVVHLRSRGQAAVPVGDEARFRAVVLAAFGQRRKAVANALAAGLHVPASTARERLRAAGIDGGRRAETLSLEEFARLTASGL